ncbi:MAG: M23 family metallopeptidase [Paracoccaceae bacterium]|nr:M23 family metallopeptidase [Paracoccaceae bacterium]
MAHRLRGILEGYLPEQRLYLRSEIDQTRFIRLSPGTQAVAIFGSAAVVGWAIIATAILLMDSISAGDAREQALRNQALYEQRLNALSDARDARAEEARAAQERFAAALEQISAMQSKLLASEDRRRELETGIGVIQATLRRTMDERDAARGERDRLVAALEGGEVPGPEGEAELAEVETTLAFLNAALESTAAERDRMADEAAEALALAEELEFERDLSRARNEKIFAQLEEALTVSVEPLEKMFTAAGLPPERLLDAVRQGYSGTGGPLTPISFSTKGTEPTEEELRANAILKGLDRMNLYRLAAEKAPFSMPVRSGYRLTSGFGQRWGRLHAGTDFAGAHGTPIYATADGVVTHAGWLSGYGRLVKIQHEFGIETRYAHMSRIRVSEGERVVKGQRIGDMGNTGRSTGTHLHYETRVNGEPINPMNFIRAARDVF